MSHFTDAHEYMFSEFKKHHDGNAIPLDRFKKKSPESELAPLGRDLRGNPIHPGIGKEDPIGKPLDQAFEVTNIPWVITVKEKPNGDTATLTFASGDRERQFRKEHKNAFIFT